MSRKFFFAVLILVAADCFFFTFDAEQVILTIAQPFANHNGGQLNFSPRDGQLKAFIESTEYRGRFRYCAKAEARP